MKVTSAELALLRTRPQQVNAKLVIYKPPIVFACRVADATIQKTAISITYDSVSTGAYTDVRSGMTMYVGTGAGKADIGRVRVKNASDAILAVAENGLDWADNLYLTVVNFYELWPKSSLDMVNGTNIIHFIDYDVPYGGQNQYMGTLLCIGPPGICEAGESIYWGSSGTVQTEGMAVDYSWSFEGGAPLTGTVADPGYIQYNTPGYYMTEATAVITGTSFGDTAYRPVIVLGGSVQPYTNWGFDSIDGSRDEGGWTAKLWLREENMPEVMDGSLCIIYQDSYYGSTRQNIGGNSPNREKVLFVGYIIDNSIVYDWKSSKMEFSVSSPTGRMKLLEGLSVSMDNVASIPVAWQQVKNLTGKKALYYYLKWHTTVLNCCDVRWTIDPDPEIPSWDSEISSVYDIAQKFADVYYLAEMVSDRQGTIWIEKHPKSIHVITGTYNTVMDMDRQDWVGEIDITEQLNSPVSYLEMHGLGYAGVATGTINDYLSAAPYINKRNPFGTADFIQGYVVNSQTENNQIVGDVFAHKNAKYMAVDIHLAGWYSLFDIAPEECITLSTVQQDTVRGVVWNKKPFMLREMSIESDLKNRVLLPTINLYEVTQGTAGASVPIPTPVQPPVYPDFPPITGGWTELPWPFSWPKPWVEPPPGGDTCRGNPYATFNGPYALPLDKAQLNLNESGTALFSCYVRPASSRNPTRVLLYGIVYGTTSWNDISVQALDSGQNVIATAFCAEDHGWPGAISYGIYQFSSLSGLEVAGFRITPVAGTGSCIHVPGEIHSSGSVQAKNGQTGVDAGSLIVGNWYSIEGSGGTWYSPLNESIGIPGPYFDFALNGEGDVGVGWGGAGNPLHFNMIKPSIAEYVESVGNYARVYFKAIAPSINFRVSDSFVHPDTLTGGLNYTLRFASGMNVDIMSALIENVCL